MRTLFFGCCAALFIAGFTATLGAAEGGELALKFRARVAAEATPEKREVVERAGAWPAGKTAVVISDMWDKHWCQDATARVAEMAPRMNELIKALRARGVLIIHCPSDTTQFYKDHPARLRAQQAPAATGELLPARKESPFPVEVVAGGCTDTPPSREGRAWSRQIDTLEIADMDAISDNGDEVFNLLRERGVENVLVMGVHTNMCILNRSFAIKALVRRGLNVALVRDLTDSMYNSQGKPHVDHFTGTDLIVEWIEQNWCPTVSSDQIIGGKPFRFAADPRSVADEHAATPTFDPTERYEVREVEGWRVLVNKSLLEQAPEECHEALRLFSFQLHDVTRRVPAEAVAKLRRIPIWLELNEPHHPCAAYHPDVNWLRANGMNPDKARCVEISNVRNFLTWTRAQPMMLLHELAHGYHDRFLEAGYRNPEVAACFARAKRSGDYDEVLAKHFARVRAYAMNNPMEYFAEASEAFFGTNDFYPFVAAELAEHDPAMFSLLEKLWGAPPEPRADNRPRLVIIASEDEYKTEQTLPRFAEKHLAPRYRVEFVLSDAEDPNSLTNLESLKTADVTLWSIRRRVLTAAQLELVRDYLRRGKPLVAIRTTSHAFAGRGESPPEGRVEWRDFDREVLGVSYQGHFNNASAGKPSTLLEIAEGAGEHALLRGVPSESWASAGTLYRSRDLDRAAQVLLVGRTAEGAAPEPVAWTRISPWRGKVFYTSLGHAQDFEDARFTRLLQNAVDWAAEPARE